MAAEVALLCGLNPAFFKLPNKASNFKSHHLYKPKKKSQHLRISANLGGGGGEGDAKKGGEKKKFITREEEPQQYWQTAGEREGENPMKTPLPYIIIFGMSTPFVILAIAFANGWIKVPGSKTLLALLVPIFAVFASGRGAFLISITLIFMSTIFLLTFCKQKPIMLIKEAQISKIDLSPLEKQQENTLINSADSSCDDDSVPVPTVEAQTGMKREDVKDQFLIASQDLYSESESMDQFSTTSSEDHSSDIEWPYSIGQRLDCSDDSISDEESLIEIAIPTGQFVSAEKDLKCCKSSRQESIFQKDFWADMNEMNEEDNLIEIDIYMGSIKCSSFEI